MLYVKLIENEKLVPTTGSQLPPEFERSTAVAMLWHCNPAAAQDEHVVAEKLFPHMKVSAFDVTSKGRACRK